MTYAGVKITWVCDFPSFVKTHVCPKKWSLCWHILHEWAFESQNIFRVRLLLFERSRMCVRELWILKDFLSTTGSLTFSRPPECAGFVVHSKVLSVAKISLAKIRPTQTIIRDLRNAYLCSVWCFIQILSMHRIFRHVKTWLRVLCLLFIQNRYHAKDMSTSIKCFPVFRLLFYSNPLHAKGMSTSEKCLRVFHLLFYSNPLLAKDISISEKCLRVFCLLFIQNPEHVQHMSISKKCLSVFRLLFIQNPEHAHDMFTPEKCLHVLCLLCYPKSCTCQHCL